MSQAPAPMIAWCGALSFLFVFHVIAADIDGKFRKKGKRFTYADGVAIHQMIAKKELMTADQIAEIYGDKQTDFRKYLEGK